MRTRIAARQTASRGLMPTLYERAGWRTDGATKIDDDIGTGVTEIRYRLELPVSGG